MANPDDLMLHKKYPATTNKWYADIPLSMISRDFGDFTLQLQNFTIPRIEVGHASLPYKGVDLQVPNRTFNASGKEAEFTYLIDENWESYLALYQWAKCYPSIDNPTPNDSVVENDNPYGWWVIPIHVHLLHPYRGDIMHIVYYGCTIKYFNEFRVTYTEKPVPMPHSFRITYQRMEIGHTDPSKNTSKGGAS